MLIEQKARLLHGDALCLYTSESVQQRYRVSLHLFVGIGLSIRFQRPNKVSISIIAIRVACRYRSINSVSRKAKQGWELISAAMPHMANGIPALASFATSNFCACTTGPLQNFRQSRAGANMNVEVAFSRTSTLHQPYVHRCRGLGSRRRQGAAPILEPSPS